MTVRVLYTFILTQGPITLMGTGDSSPEAILNAVGAEQAKMIQDTTYRTTYQWDNKLQCDVSYVYWNESGRELGKILRG